MKPSSNQQTHGKKSNLNDELLSIVKGFVDYFESVDEDLTQEEVGGREE